MVHICNKCYFTMYVRGCSVCCVLFVSLPKILVTKKEKKGSAIGHYMNRKNFLGFLNISDNNFSYVVLECRMKNKLERLDIFT